MQRASFCRLRWLSVTGARLVLLLTLFVVARGKGSPGRQLEQRPTEPSPVFTSQGRITRPSNSSEGGGNIILPDLLPLGVHLLAAADNPQPSADACCNSCRQLQGCNVVYFCSPEQEADCRNEFHNITLPPGGCELVSQALSGPDTGRPLVAVYAEGFTGGAPIEFMAPEIDGYTSLYGVSLWYRNDMTCPPGLNNVALPTSCGVVGDPTELSEACNADDRCQAMSYFPYGRDYQEDPVVLFKGGTGAALNLSDATLNQNTVLYVKNAPAAVAAAGGGGGLSGAAVAGIAVGACCGAAVLAATTVILVRHHRRQQQLAAAGAPWDGKLSNVCHGVGGSGAGKLEGDCQVKECLELEEGKGALPHKLHTAGCASSMGSKGGAGGAYRLPGTDDHPPTPPPSMAHLSIQASQSGRGGPGGFQQSPASLPQTGAGCGASSKELPGAGAGALDRLAFPGELAPLPENAASWQSSIDFCRTADGDRVQLGSGAFATVYRVLLDGVQPYAAKVIPLRGDARAQAAFLKESGMLRQLRHRNIVQFAGAYITDDGDGVILMELMEGGDLHTRLLSQTRAGERLFAWGHRGRTVALDVARALHYLHGLKLTHFDIKTRNVLLTRDITAKVADVGFTRPMYNTHHSLSDGRTGTFDYMAPELLLGRKCSQSVDIYAYGVLLWELCTGEYPVRGCLRALAVPGECPEEVSRLVLECMDEDPAQRPTARELVQRLQRLQHPQQR